MVRFGVLGPLEAANEHGPVDLKGPRHRAVLARLLVAGGRVVPVRWLIDDLWDDPPEGALGAVQTFVGALRKALEPARAPRTPSRLLVTVAPGYALRADPGAVDARRFETAVAASGGLVAEGRPEDARVLLDDVLALWRGPAYAEFAEQDWARGEATRLDEVRLLAVERRAEAALALGRAAETVPGLHAHVEGHPLREDGWRLLALALYRTGRQGDALATIRRAGERLRTELGVDPGPPLRQLESDILTQAAHLTLRPPPHPPPHPHPHPPPHSPPPHSPPAPHPHPHPPRPQAPPPPHPQVPQPKPSAPPPTPLPPPPPPTPQRSVGGVRFARQPFVGRTAELAQLEQAAATAVATGRPRLALLSGTAGAGKTALAETLAGRLAATGWTTAWGACPELDGAPAAWPWTRMRDSLTAAGHRFTERPPDDDPLTARFRRHRDIGAHLAGIAATSPVMLVFDDLHWADEETLALLTALAADPAGGPVLLVGTYRSTDLSTPLTEALGRAARTEPTRVYLGGLTEPQVREVVRAMTDREMTAAVARTIHARSAGNPFFVRELTRLWEVEGDAALHDVPAGVRDVIRHRLAGLTATARTHLRQAAVLGHEVDLDVLIPLAGDEDEVLDDVESALLAGFLVEQDDDRLRFAHALVHQTLYDDIAAARRTRWHAAAADVIEDVRPGEVEAIAHHLVRAGNRADPARTARHTRAAAERAERRSAPHEAARLWRETITALDRADNTDTHARLAALMGLVRALAVTGDLDRARHHRAEAVTAAEALNDPVVTAGVIGSFDVPAIWTTNDDEALSARLVTAAERTLAALPPGHDTERARLLVAIAMERRADASPRAHAAALEAEATARRLGDPTLLVHALNGRFLQTFHRAGLAPERAAIGAELLDLAGRHGLVTFEVLGHLILVQANAAQADLAAADRHAAAADALAERCELPLVGVFTDWYAALRLAVTDRPDEARAAYRAAATRLAGAGMPGLEHGLLPLALLSLGTLPADADWGPYESWVRPLVLLAQGNRDEARAAARDIPDSPRDLLFEARTCLHAMIAIRLEDRPTMERLHAELLPAAGELAGAGSGLLTFGPTAQHLGDLSAALGRHDQAARHHRQAQAVRARAQERG